MQLAMIRGTDNMLRVVVNQKALSVLSLDLLLQVLVIIYEFLVILRRSNRLLKRMEVTNMFTSGNIIIFC